MKRKIQFVSLSESEILIKKNFLNLILITFLLSFSIIKAQATLDFRNPNLISGVNLQLNAKYRFQNVTTLPSGVNVDCLVTITNLQHATLNQFDDNADHLGNGNSSFDPIVQLDGTAVNGSVDGSYAEFRFDFVLNSNNNISVDIEIDAYSMDIDGDTGNIREYVIISDFNGYVLNNNTLLNYIPQGRFEAQTDAVNPGIDPNERYLAKTTYTLLNNFTYRAGVLRDFGFGTTPRQFALAFEPIIFSNPNPVIFIDAVDDDFTATPINGDTGGLTSSVFINNGNGIDIVNDSPATNANVSNNISIVDSNGLNNVSINNDGSIVVPANTISGTYNVSYKICMEANNLICDIATATIVVTTVPNPCDEIIPPGNPTNQIAEADITWDFTGTGPAGDIILNGISIAGEPNEFTNLITPDNVIVNVQNLNASKKVVSNGTVIADGNLGLAAFSAFVLAEAQDTNLNHYLKFDPGNGGTTQGDYVDYLYDSPIISSRNRYVVATERGGNNSSSTQMLDINGNPIGVKAMNIAGNNYFATGATHDNGQLVKATVYPTTALVPRGTLIYGIRYMQEDNGDGADGQAFILRDPATIGCTITAQDDDFTATPIASGSSTPSVFLDNGNGTDDANGSPATNANIADNISITNNGGIAGLSINPDGTITIPTGTPAGNYTVNYQICLDIDNTKCDVATVTFVVLTNPDFAPTILTGNTTIIGATGVVDFRVLIGEFGNGASNGISSVELRIVKNSDLTISFDNTLTMLNGQPVSNNQWQYDGSHPSLHKFIYIGNGGIFNANTAQFIGINAVYNPLINTSGSFPLKTTVKSFSGGETNNANNNDIDYIEYNNN